MPADPIPVVDALLALAGSTLHSIDRAVLAEVLEAELEAARQAWPDLELDEPAFVRFLGERVPDGDDPAATVGRLRVPDLALAFACLAEDPKGLAIFEREIMPAVAKAVARLDGAPTFVDEVSATVRVKLLVGTEERPAALSAYLGSGPLTSFAQVVATREALSRKRKKSKEEPVDRDSLLQLPLEDFDPELDQIRRQVEPTFRDAFREALAALEPRERTILRLYLVEGVGSATIGKMYGVHRATVARWVADAREAVFSATKKRMMKELHLGSESFTSLMGKVSTQLDVTLSSFLEGD
ncbi:MAG: sigma-70 family RNA polymerase sigma factor [Deltaproteobacteria bacterium]|nr:sigma-70 family RNA polymerase sigma factor [Deltaproteobacteria bacterium]